ncbi:hypothetical protein ABK040_010675 [Willaertia magna]
MGTLEKSKKSSLKNLMGSNLRVTSNLNDKDDQSEEGNVTASSVHSYDENEFDRYNKNLEQNIAVSQQVVELIPISPHHHTSSHHFKKKKKGIFLSKKLQNHNHPPPTLSRKPSLSTFASLQNLSGDSNGSNNGFHRTLSIQDFHVHRHTVENSQHCFHSEESEEMEVFEMYDKLLQNNIEYVQEKLELDPNFFLKHKETQKPNYLLIGCSDSRVPPDQMLKTPPGELFIHRNVANLVVNTDLNLMAVLQYAVEVLKVKHVIVMGHSRCGGVKASLENCYHGLIDKWLRNIKDVQRLHKDELDKIKNFDKKWERLIELNVIEQSLNICKTSIIQRAWQKGQAIHVHGWVCDIETGLIKDLEIEETLWQPIENIYKIEFSEKELE